MRPRSASGSRPRLSCGTLLGYAAVIALFAAVALLALMPHFFRRFDWSRFLKSPWEEIQRAADKAEIPLEPEAPPGVRTLRQDRLVIQYEPASPAAGVAPFVQGQVENTGTTAVSKLVLEMRIAPASNRIHTESFEILRNDPLLPGQQRRFIVHPSDAPSGWTPGRVSLRIVSFE